ncbi:MAG: FlgD immunoglobulin-like domain containing protein [bacterium]
MKPIGTSSRTFAFAIALAALPAWWGVPTQAADSKAAALADKRWTLVQPVPTTQAPAPPEITEFGSIINPPSILTPPNATDIAVKPSTVVTQSEVSIAINPTNPNIIFASANASQWPVNTFYGTGVYWSTDGGTTWTGDDHGPGGVGNSGDPAAAIRAIDNRWLVGYISSAGQGVSYTTNGGTTWAARTCGTGNLDKNHMCADNVAASAFYGNLYSAWTNFGGTNINDIEAVRSTDGGNTWGSLANISNNVNAGSHNQGVNLRTGPNGTVYACWAIYDGWPTDETAIGFNKSTNGGASWVGEFRAITNIRGVRQGIPNTTNRTNSFPSMAVDVSGGPRNGWIYIAWTNRGVPGVNNGDPDCYVSRSTNGGTTWGTPVRINQDATTRSQWFPWITCDPTSGQLAVIFYDRRDNTADTQCRAYMAVSNDGAATWEDFPVADVSFTPTPIPGLATGYMGDYLGIDMVAGHAMPIWMDNRGGNYLAYVSPTLVSDPLDPNPPTNVAASSNLGTPTSVLLTWTDPTTHVNGTPLPNFSIDISRDDVFLVNVNQGNQTFTDTGLTDGQLYHYALKSRDDVTDSTSSAVNVQAYAGGSPTAVLLTSTTAITRTIFQSTTDTQHFTISNPGALNRTLNWSLAETPDQPWLTVNPLSGAIVGNGSTQLTVLLDATALTPGTYLSDLVITANDPANPADTVHVTLNVNGVPVVHAAPPSISVTLAPLGTTTQEVTLSNSGNGDLNYTLTTSGGANRLEFPSEAFSQTGPTTFRGNVYRVDTATPLKEIQERLNVPASTPMEFFVYQNTAASGTFTKIFSTTITSGTGLAWYSSGPINVSLQAGKYYFIGAGWSGTVTAYSDFGTTPPLPLSIPFGAAMGPGGGTGYPPPASTVQGGGSWLYSIALGYGENFALTLLSPSSGTVAASGSTPIDVQITAQSALGIFHGSINVASNDPITPLVTVPITLTVSNTVDAPAVTAPLPKVLALQANAPNPFRGGTEIRYDLPKSGPVSLKIYDVTGRLVRTLVNGTREAGFRSVTWDGIDDAGHRSAAGVYFYTLQAQDKTFQRKMIQLR